MGKIYVKQEITFQADTNQDISTATSRELSVKRPDNVIKTYAASLVVGSSTKLEWTSSASDLDIPGVYRIQALVSFGGGKQTGETFSITVHNEFD